MKNVHRKINNLLTAVVVGFGLYLILSPILPSIDFWFQKRAGFDVPAFASSSEVKPEDIPTDNRIAIASIGLNEVILDGPNSGLINDGAYRQYHTSTPDQGSNTVITGHRFTYSPSVAAPFYHLDKVKVGEEIVVAWGGKVYRYKVVETKVVEPTEIGVEAPTEDSTLTLYTCTPLWTAEKRLVIVAKLEGQNE